MNRTVFRQIPDGSRLLAVGNFFRAPTPAAEWRLAALFERNGQLQLHRFARELSCVLAVGRKFSGEDVEPFRSTGSAMRVVLPAIDTWQERQLGECQQLERRLAKNSEMAGQRCFVFEADGLTIWLPKFELARKLFFHSAFLVRAAFAPSGLDMLFTVCREDDAFHIYTPVKTGVPSSTLKSKGYREHFSWLLLNPDVRRAFDSIWQSLNQEQEQSSNGSAYARWRFSFIPPATLAGVSMSAQGALDLERKEFLVWEIKVLQGLQFTNHGDVFFHHPGLKLPVRGEGSGCASVPSGTIDIEVDADEEPTAARQAKSIQLPVETIHFDGQITTRIAYNSEGASSHGKKVDDEQLPRGKSQAFGMADAVTGGSITPGEFNQLADEEGQKQFADRFSQLREIIVQIVRESEIELLFLEVKPLPPVSRCRYHMIDSATPRCYLLARFRLSNGCERYLLEIDTSDSRKLMSTRIMGFKPSNDVGQCIIDRILRAAVKGSLRWPGVMVKYCDPLHSVHHPKEGPLDAYQARLSGWKQRIHAALS